MADGEENSMIDKDSLLQIQKRERRELQARIQELKNAVPKGDKKKKREAAAEVARLERELDVKHSAERGKLEELGKNGLTEDALPTELSSRLHLNPSDSAHGGEGKVSKAQKRRDKKALEAKEREARIAQQDVENLQGNRHLEEVSIKALLRGRGLALYQIPADGNCLYQAVVHQLSLNKEKPVENCGVPGLRLATSTQMRKNRDDYLPFLTNPQTGEILTTEEFEAYCTDLETTNAWGGQIELRALSESLKMPIEVVQASGPPILLGEEFLPKEKPLVLSYHRHAFGLGEHYNSVVVKTTEDGEDSEDSTLK